MNQSDPILKTDLDSLLGDTFLRRVVHFAEADSTNTRAIDLLASEVSLSTPCLVYAEHQWAGRGRGANRWWSAEGSLTFSLIVDFQKMGLPADRKQLLPLLTGMAVVQIGESLVPAGDFSLKWPNDVYLAGRKLSGVLTEVPSQSAGQAVIGVGLNVNNRFAAAPDELRATCISISDRSGMSHDRVEVLRLFLQRFESLVGSLAQGNRFLDLWPRYCLLSGKMVTLQAGGEHLTGICHGIDAAGALMLEINGRRNRFFGGTVLSWF